MLIRPPVHFVIPVVVDGIGLQFSGAVAPAAAGEPVREHLIDHRPLGPSGGIEVRRDAADLPKVPRLHIGVVPLLEQAEGAVRVRNAEVIEIQAGFLQAEAARPVFIGADGLLKVQLFAAQFAAILPAEYHFRLPGHDRHRDMHTEGAILPGGQAPKRALVLGQLAVKKDSHRNLSP